MMRKVLLVLSILLVGTALVKGQEKASIGSVLKPILLEQGMERATELYYNLKRHSAGDYDFSEKALDALGEELLRDQYVEEAVSIYGLNVNAYPNSADAYASYGVAMLAKGDTLMAKDLFDYSNYRQPNSKALVALYSVLDEEDYQRKAVGAEGHIYAYSPFEMYDYTEMDSPEAQGIPTDMMIDFFERGHEIPQLVSLSIARNSQVLGEHYYRYHPFYRADLKEGTTSILSILLGIALKKGHIKSLDSPIRGFFDYSVSGSAANLSLRDLISMRSGLQLSERDLETWENERYKHKMAMQLPLRSKQFKYDKVAAHLVSGAIEEATGLHTLRYGKQQLFHPAILYPKEWVYDELKYNYGGEGLCLTSRDMMMIGNIMLDDGRYKGSKQLIPNNWLSEAATKISDLSDPGSDKEYLRNYGYGLGFWVHYYQNKKVILASGTGGQNIAVVPALGLTIVTCGDHWDSSGEEAIKDLIFEIIGRVNNL